MTIINKELYEALKIAKVPEKKALSAAENFLPAKEIATKRDLMELKGELEKKIMELENRLTWRFFGMSLSSSALIVALVKFL